MFKLPHDFIIIEFKTVIYLGKVDEGGTLLREGNFDQWGESQGARLPPPLNELLYFNIIQDAKQI